MTPSNQATALLKTVDYCGDKIICIMIVISHWFLFFFKFCALRPLVPIYTSANDKSWS